MKYFDLWLFNSGVNLYHISFATDQQELHVPICSEGAAFSIQRLGSEQLLNHATDLPGLHGAPQLPRWHR